MAVLNSFSMVSAFFFNERIMFYIQVNLPLGPQYEQCDFNIVEEFRPHALPTISQTRCTTSALTYNHPLVTEQNATIINTT